MTAPTVRGPSIEFDSGTGHRITFEPSPKRVRVMFNGKTMVDSLCAGLMRETGRMPVYYFAPQDVRTDLLTRTAHGTRCPYRGDAGYWTSRVGDRQSENAVWSYADPPAEFAGIKGWLAFDWNKADHWFEEDEEVFGHPRDPRHRIDVRPSSREVRVQFADETIALSRRALFLFETGLPTRYYIPLADLRTEFLAPSQRTTICPYKGQASYWSVRVGDRSAKDAVWAYMDPLPECPRIKGHFCFYPDKVDLLDVEGEGRAS